MLLSFQNSTSFILSVCSVQHVHDCLFIADNCREYLNDFRESPGHKQFVDLSLLDKFVGEQKDTDYQKQRTTTPDSSQQFLVQ